MKKLSIAALVCAVLAWPVAGEAQEPDLMTAKYRVFAAAQMGDDKCHVLSFSDRKMIDDILLVTLTQLPGVLAVDPTDYEAYFAAVGAAAEPIRSELEPAIVQLPCDRAPMLIGSAQMQGYADILAYLRLGEEAFQAQASAPQMQMAQIFVGFLNQSLGQNAAQFEQLVQARQAEFSEDHTPEQAAGMARTYMNQMNISRAIQAKGIDLRWNAEEDGWGLWALQENRFERGLVFGAPAFSQTFTVLEGETEWGNQIIAHSVIVLAGREYNSTLKIMVLAADPESPAIPDKARIGYGQGWADFRSFEGRRSSDCPMDACFSFSGTDLDGIRLAGAPGSASQPELTLYQDHTYLQNRGAETMRDRAGLSARDSYPIYPDRIFKDED